MAPAIAVFRRWGSLEFYDIRLRKLAVVLYNITICKNYKDTVYRNVLTRDTPNIRHGHWTPTSRSGLGSVLSNPSDVRACIQINTPYKKKKTKQRPKMIFSLIFAHVSSIFHSFLMFSPEFDQKRKQKNIACSRVPVLTRKFLE